MNIQDIDLAEESVVNIIKLVTNLYEVYKKGMTKEKLLQLWDIITENTKQDVANFNEVVGEMQE